ncbi:MAG: CdaR family protein [Bryobacteraceae bacterium]
MLKFVTRNIGYKLFSLAAAVGIWYAMLDQEQELTASISAPVEYRNIPKELEVSSDVSDKVQLEIRGPAGKLTPANLAGAVVLLDLKSVSRPGERTFPITTGDVTLPPGLVVDKAVPSQVRLSFERRLVREVPVTIKIGAPPPAGFEVVNQRVAPAMIRIAGPESRVREISSVETDPVDLSDTKGTEEFPVNVYVSDPRVRPEEGAARGSGGVKVHIEVKPGGAGRN